MSDQNKNFSFFRLYFLTILRLMLSNFNPSIVYASKDIKHHILLLFYDTNHFMAIFSLSFK